LHNTGASPQTAYCRRFTGCDQRIVIGLEAQITKALFLRGRHLFVTRFGERRKTKILFGQNQLVLFRPSKPIDLAVVLDPDFISTTGERIEADDLGERGPPTGGSIRKCLAVLGSRIRF